MKYRIIEDREYDDIWLRIVRAKMLNFFFFKTHIYNNDV